MTDPTPAGQRPAKSSGGGQSGEPDPIADRLRAANAKLDPHFTGTINHPFKSAEPLDQQIEQSITTHGRAGRRE